MKNHIHHENIIDPKRRNIVLLGFSGITLGIIARLGYLQILNGKHFEVASFRNRMREVILPAPRGMIYDAEGRLLIENKEFYDLVIIPQYLQNPDKTITILSNLFNISENSIYKKLQEAQATPKFLPVTIKKNLSSHEVILLESKKFFLPGINITTETRRLYKGQESAHLFGYISEITAKELEVLNVRNKTHPYQPNFTVGKTGIEKKCESYLRGKEGKEIRLVDAYGRLQSTSVDAHLQEKAARGNDVYLTIDKDLQAVAERAFNEKNGAVCAINPQTGAILVYLSNPNYKLSLYQDGLSATDWQSLRNNPFHPLLDKVTGGAYPPGSVFKVIPALAGLDQKLINSNTRFFCPGYYNLGSQTWKCWNHDGHGSVNLQEALMQSCDVYFYNLSYQLGIDPITKWARLFGLGERTGLDLNMEITGVVPSQEWKLHTKGVKWQQGDTINAGFGQGFNTCTPIQILNLFAAIANGGKLYKPYLIDRIVNLEKKVIERTQPYLIRDLQINPAHLAVVRKGLQDVVESARGTAKLARVPGFSVSGKTGTAQNSSLKFTKGYEKSELDFRLLDHAWFAGYTPSENPEIAVVVFSEYEGGGGGKNSAPIAQQIFEAYYRKKYPDKFITQKEARS